MCALATELMIEVHSLIHDWRGLFKCGGVCNTGVFW